jgi:hypothetical protein
MINDFKNCPFCGENIKEIAIKCKHCKSQLNLNNISVSIKQNSRSDDIIDLVNKPSEVRYELIPHGFVVFNISFLIIGTFIQLIVSNSIIQTGKSEYAFDEIYDNSKWQFLYAAVAGIFCILDFYNLKKLGIQVKYGLVAALLMTPFYLYLRGSKLNEIYKLGWGKSQSFFIGWVIIFAISIPIEQYLLKLV